MEALKQTRIKRNGNELVLILPESFKAAEVDVLIWPSLEETGDVLQNIRESLLNWPEMTNEELSAINEKRKHLNKWK